MREYKHIFGPVPSRRLGRSLGVDLTPFKTCSQDRVFCQLGPTTKKTLTRHEYVPMKEVLEELEEWLKRDGKADHITLSGSGEPTLHSSFGDVLGFVRKNKSVKAVLLTNGSLFHLRKSAGKPCKPTSSRFLCAHGSFYYNATIQEHNELYGG